MTHIFTSLPSPSNGVWSLGPIPLRAYALIILAGIGVAIWLGNKRWIERGGVRDQVMDVAMWAVPFGVIGGRIYHVLTDWSSYFSANGKGFIASLKIWEGGLGIWGAIALGGVGAYIAARKMNLSFLPLADALAPGIVLAQAIGRWGNWFNQELFGRPTTLPWGLEISAARRPVGYEEFATFHPTFLYESLACVAIAAILIWADKKFTLGHGRVFALYVALYCSARGVIETLRIDEANKILGIRLNVFTALFIGAAALVYLVLSAERYPGREVLANGQVLSARALRELELNAANGAAQSEVNVATAGHSVDVETEREIEQEDSDYVANSAQYSEDPEAELEAVPESEDRDLGPAIEPASTVSDSGNTQTEIVKERGRRRKR